MSESLKPALPGRGIPCTLILLSLLGCGPGQPEAEQLRVSLPSLYDAEHFLSTTELAGPSVLNLWASWCLPCRREMPELMTLATEHGVPIYGLNYLDEPQDAQRWLDYYGDPFRLVGSDPDGRHLRELAVAGIPQTLVVDAEGRIHHHHIGPLTRTVIADTVLPALEAIDQKAIQNDR